MAVTKTGIYLQEYLEIYKIKFKGCVTTMDTFLVKSMLLNHTGKYTKAFNRVKNLEIMDQRVFQKNNPQTKTTQEKKRKNLPDVEIIDLSKKEYRKKNKTFKDI